MSFQAESLVKTLAPAGELVYVQDWIEPDRADALFESLRGEVTWQTRTITMFGRRVLQPRLIAFQGDDGIRYAYSGETYRSECWHPAVAGLRDALAGATGVRFNCALLNLYRHGQDSMGWHADNEPELGSEPTIASISLGAERRFVLRRRCAKQCRVELVPAHGSLIVMRGDVQHHWQHQVPKTARATDERINLTFRKIVRNSRQHSGRAP